MRAGLVQITAGPDPETNLPVTLELIREAVAQGAGFVLTPEVTNIVSMDRAHSARVLHVEEEDAHLAAFCAEAARAGIWLLAGSLAVKTGDAEDTGLANRSYLISPAGEVVARYDKIHMFDVQIDATETYRESAGYRPGARAVLADAGWAKIGMTICYDVRFPALHRKLAKAGAQILTAPAAFSPVTGAAHWEPLLRARAIETGCYVLAPAQCGHHGAKRHTHGHSLAVSPWGEVLADGGCEPGVVLVDLDMAQVERARARVPSLEHDRTYEGPG